MEPTQQIIDDLYREKVRRARGISLARRVEIGAELSDMGLQVMREAIRAEQPTASNEQIHRMMQERIALSRQLDDLPLPRLDQHNPPENGA